MEAYEQYLDAYRLDLNSYYPGLNALVPRRHHSRIGRTSIQKYGAQFADDTSADVKLAEIKRKRDQIAQALQLRFEMRMRLLAEGTKQDIWLLSSAGDLNLLTQPQSPPRHLLLQKSRGVGRRLRARSARRQLQYVDADLGVLKRQVEEVLKVLPPESKPAADQRIDRVLLFTGHRIDSANRPNPVSPPTRRALPGRQFDLLFRDEKEHYTGLVEWHQRRRKRRRPSLSRSVR